ncbi:sodium:proline symporter [Brevirhabdus sp.]|uniref:sodium:proline symporter n=1 Tax=Brevirhabdus sp. TaxID=2004514 RepID=UPI0040590720
MYLGLVTGVFALVVLLSFAVAPRRSSVEGFFAGLGESGKEPGLWTLALSQVTTWIFARSLMNSAILGYYYGMPGTLAYAAYYGSFLTGGLVVSRLRADGRLSVQDWLGARFGTAGRVSYNGVIALRLLSEVFANLLVVGLIFSALAPQSGWIGPVSILVVALIALAYSAWGGLSAALRTDVVQMALFLTVFGLAFVALVAGPGFSPRAVVSAQGASGTGPGWLLLGVALLQVFSYPVHDPVMMDRGFVSDARVTRRSFFHAFWISTLCILAFGVFGIQASLENRSYEGELIGTWALMFPGWLFAAVMVSLLVSALSTLDSALASAARLSADELRLVPRSLAGGRVAMIGFLLLGAALTLWGNSTLFDAVAVSGTASMFLTPVLVTGLFLRRRVPLWSYMTAFVAAIAGAGAYFFRSTQAMAEILPEAHKYEQLLVICVAVLAVGFAAVLAGARHPLADRG